MNSQQKFAENGDIIPEWLIGSERTDSKMPTLNEYLRNHKGILQDYDAKPAHYNNEKGSIYKFCNDQELNPWEFDIIKRIVRCRKKGQFKEDLEKTKMAIDLYLTEYNGR
jgi:hypothetical protein